MLRAGLNALAASGTNIRIDHRDTIAEMDGIKLSFTEEALDFMVDKAVEYKLGARGLRSIVEAVMTDAMFEVPSKKIKKFEVTLDYAKGQLDKAHLGQLESA